MLCIALAAVHGWYCCKWRVLLCIARAASLGACCRKRCLVLRMAQKGHQAVQKPSSSSGCMTRAKLKAHEKQLPIVLKKKVPLRAS